MFSGHRPVFGSISARCGGTHMSGSCAGISPGRSPRGRRNLAGSVGVRDGSGSISARAEEVHPQRCGPR